MALAANAESDSRRTLFADDGLAAALARLGRFVEFGGPSFRLEESAMLGRSGNQRRSGAGNRKACVMKPERKPRSFPKPLLALNGLGTRPLRPRFPVLPERLSLRLWVAPYGRVTVVGDVGGVGTYPRRSNRGWTRIKWAISRMLDWRTPMAKEQISVQEMEDFSLLLSDLLVRDAWSNHNVPECELKSAIRQAAACINMTFSYNGSASAVGNDERGRHYTATNSTERKLVQNAQIRLGHRHVSAHDCIYYLIAIVSMVALKSAIGGLQLPASASGPVSTFADRLSDHLAQAWGKRFGLVRIPDEHMSIVCAAITCSCGNPFGVANNAESFSAQDVIDLLDSKGFFLSADDLSVEPQLLPHAFLPVYDSRSNATSDQKIQLMRQLSNLVAFEHWPSHVPPASKERYVRDVLEAFIDAGLFEHPHNPSTKSASHDVDMYVYCL